MRSVLPHSRITMRLVLCASLLLNAIALVAYVILSHGIDIRQRAVESEISPEAAKELLRLLIARANVSALEHHASSSSDAGREAREQFQDGKIGGIRNLDDAQALGDGAELYQNISGSIVREYASWFLNSIRTTLLLLPAAFGVAAFVAMRLQACR